MDYKSPQEREGIRNYIKDNIMTTTEAMEYLGVTRMRLNTYSREGRLEQISRGIFLKADVIAFKEAFDKAREEGKWLKEFK